MDFHDHAPIFIGQFTSEFPRFDHLELKWNIDTMRSAFLMSRLALWPAASACQAADTLPRSWSIMAKEQAKQPKLKVHPLNPNVT